MLVAMLRALLAALLVAYATRNAWPQCPALCTYGRTDGLTKNTLTLDRKGSTSVPGARVRDLIQFSAAYVPGDSLLPPEDYHSIYHEGEFATCWLCGKARATCRRKIRFNHWSEADEWVRDLNETRKYRNPVARYRCRWCRGWHMTSVTSKIQRSRTEKQRRKWLAKTVRGST